MLFYITAINSSWSSWLLYGLPVNGILSLSLCSMHVVQIRPTEQRPVLLAHTFCSILHSTENKNVKECERGRINKEKYNHEAWFSVSWMRIYAWCSFFINFTNLPWFLFYSCFSFPASTCNLQLNQTYDISVSFTSLNISK